MYIELTIGGEIYKLRLTTKNSIQLERALGYNPLTMLMEIDKGKMPKLNDVITILQYCLLPYHHGFNLDKTMELFDTYVEDGHNMFDLIPVFIEVFKNSGYISKEVTIGDTAEKN